MKSFLSQAWALTLAGELHGRLSPPRRFVAQKLPVRGGVEDAWEVRGKWALRAHGERGEHTVGFTFRVRSSWLWNPPVVNVDAGFLRKEADWHVYADASLCNVLREEWSARLEEALVTTASDMGRVTDFAATWCLSAADSLVTRHLMGARFKIQDWPKHWNDWAHGKTGARQFEREFRRERRAA